MKNKLLDFIYSRSNIFFKNKRNNKIFINKKNHDTLLEISKNINRVNQSDAPDLIYRCKDIEKIIKKNKPIEVIEIGSGRSTLAFALLSKKYSFQHIAFEQSQEWVKLINKYIQNMKILNSKVTFAPIIQVENGGYLKHDIKECDLIYIDGPTVVKKKDLGTFSGKPEYYDIINYFNENIFPKVIMIEGRNDTVEMIRKSKYAKLYKFYPEYSISYKKNDYYQMLFFRRHSFFIKK